MSGPRGGLALRLSFRLGRFRWLLRFPPRFHRRQWIVVFAILLPAGYVVSALPTIMALERIGALNHPLAQQCIKIVYAPLGWLDMHVVWCHQFFEGEKALLEWMFGK